jgi:hypothetical protein
MHGDQLIFVCNFSLGFLQRLFHRFHVLFDFTAAL